MLSKAWRQMRLRFSLFGTLLSFGQALGAAIEKFLEENKSPSRKAEARVGQICSSC